MCLCHLIYTVRPCLIHTCHVMLRPCRSSQGHSTAISRWPCCGLQKNGMVGACNGHGMASMNQTRSQCVNHMGKTHSKPFATRHGQGMLCVNRPLPTFRSCLPLPSLSKSWTALPVTMETTSSETSVIIHQSTRHHARKHSSLLQIFSSLLPDADLLHYNDILQSTSRGRKKQNTATVL